MLPASPNTPPFSAGVSRRGFLIRSAGSGVLFAWAGCFGDHDAEYRAKLPPGTEPVNLPPREYMVLESVAHRMVPGTAEFPGARELGVAARIDHELGFHSARLRADMRDALRLVEWWPWLTRFRRFTCLEEADQDVVLAAILSSPWGLPRSAFQGIKMFVMFFHYTCAETWAGIGYAGPWVPRGPEI